MLGEKCLIYLLLTITPTYALSSLLQSNTRTGYFKDGSSYYTCTVPNVLQCQSLCTYQPMCASYNYAVQSGICDLNQDSTQVLLTAEHDTVYALPAQRTSQITSADCESNEVCVRHGNQECECFPLLQIDCGSPPVQNGSDVTAPFTAYASVATYVCQMGYDHLGGSGVSTCLSNASWSPVDILCQEVAIDCGPPPVVTGSDVTVTNTTYSSTAMYACQEGYEHVGGSEISTCLGTANWSRVDINCSEVDCGPPPEITGSDVTVTNTTYSSTAMYACQEGYEHVGGSEISTCLSTANWSRVDINCSEIDCGPPPFVNGSDVTEATTTFNSTVTYTCQEGYEYLGGSGLSTCLNNSTWSTVQIDCKLLDCGWPNYIDGAMVHYVTTTYGSTAVYNCVKTFTSTGDGTSVCGASGNWSETSLTCTATHTTSWDKVATTVQSNTPSAEKADLKARVTAQCKPTLKIKVPTSSTEKLVKITTYGFRSSNDNVWAQAVKSLSKSSWSSFDTNPKRQFELYMSDIASSNLFVTDSGNSEIKTHDGTHDWIVNTDPCVSAPYGSDGTGPLINALLSGASGTYEGMFYIDDNNSTVASQLLGGVSQSTTSFKSSPYWYDEKRTSQVKTFHQRWDLGGNFQSEAEKPVLAPWCVDTCWYDVFNSLTSFREKQRNTRQLVDGVRHGHNILVKTRNVLSSALDVYMYGGHVTVSLAEFWIPTDSTAFSSTSRKTWLVASTNGVVRQCRHVPESSSVDSIQEYQETPAWFMDSRKWTNVLKIDGMGSVLSGSRSHLVNDLQQGRSLRVGISHTNGVYNAMSIDTIDFNDSDHVAAEVIHRVNLIQVSDYSYNYTSTCQLKSSIITTEGSYKIYTYDLGNGGTHTTVSDVVSIDWFICM